MSGTISMQQWIFEEAYGRKLIDLGDSNVDLRSLAEVPGALEAIRDLPLGYGHEAGLPDLRERIAGRHPGVRPSNVITAHGSQEAFSLVMRAIEVSRNSEVLVVGSGWVQHAELPHELGYRVVRVPASDDQQELLRKCAELACWRTKAIVVASPDNPTVWRASKALLEGLCELAEAYEAVLIVDEEYVVESNESFAGFSEAVVVLSGLSKMHGLPGLRLGWCIASDALVERCRRRKHLTTISNSVLCEVTAAAVLDHERSILMHTKGLCAQGASELTAWANEQERIRIIGLSETVPFAWMRVHRLDTLSLARRALDLGVLVIPGEVFGASGHLRVTIGRNPVVLKDGLARLGAAMNILAAVEREAS